MVKASICRKNKKIIKRKYHPDIPEDIISGKAEPSALLPLQMPADMRIVEEQFEDVPRDMKCYTDSEGHLYDFAFGMNWKGVIDDERVAKYK